jgi:hypothetical protein
MIIMPRKEIILPVNMTVGLKGFFRFRVRRPDGRVRIDTGWFPNKILDSGKNIMADHSTWMNYCQVGTDNTAPTALDTGLGGHHAGTSNVTTTTDGREGSAPYFGWKRKTFRFAAGTVAANLSEAGVGWGTTGSTLISRALILDPVLQTPTTITPLADELLDVDYELRYYPPLGDVTSPQVTLNGATYDTVSRACRVTDDSWSADIGNAMGWANSADWDAFDGALGTITTAPSGSSANHSGTDPTNSAYVNNSYEVDVNIAVGTTGWNLGAGIRCIRISTTAGEYQTSFTNVSGGGTIPKTTGYTMAMHWTLGWTEKP